MSEELLIGGLALAAIMYLSSRSTPPPQPPGLEVRGANVRASWIMPSGANYNKMWWDVAKDIGINTFRLTLDIALNGNWNNPNSYTIQQLTDYFNLAETYGIKTIVLIPPDGYPSNEAASKTMLNPFIQAFSGDSRILMWNIKNEPDISLPANKTWLTDMSQWFHSVDPTHPITIGGWHNAGVWQAPIDGKVLEPLVDIMCPHFYDSSFTNYVSDSLTDLTLNKQYANGKPVILEEYGWTIDGTPTTLQQQLSVYQTTINQTRSLGYRGSCLWAFVPPYPLGTDIGNMSPVYQDGTYYPAADYLKSLWNPTTTQLDAEFLTFSDTHVGRTSSTPDGLTAVQRFQKLLLATNKLKVRFISDNGDLIDGWCMQNGETGCTGTTASYVQADTNMYNSYLGIKVTSTNPFLQVRGNHDANPSLYGSMVDSINWSKRFEDILVVGIGCVAISGSDWEYSNPPNGITYDVTTVNFLNNVIASSDYANTKYHFLLHHFVPYLDSTPGINTVTAGVDAVYNKFDMAFCGHLGGGPSVWTNRAAPCVKSDHLADGLTNMGFNSVHINRSTNEISVIHHGLDGSTSTLLVYHKTLGATYTAAEAGQIYYPVDMTAALNE